MDTVKCVMITVCPDKLEEDLRDKGFEGEERPLDELMDKIQEKISNSIVSAITMLGASSKEMHEVSREWISPGKGNSPETSEQDTGADIDAIWQKGKGTPKGGKKGDSNIDCKWCGVKGHRKAQCPSLDEHMRKLREAGKAPARGEAKAKGKGKYQNPWRSNPWNGGVATYSWKGGASTYPWTQSPWNAAQKGQDKGKGKGKGGWMNEVSASDPWSIAEPTWPPQGWGQFDPILGSVENQTYHEQSWEEETYPGQNVAPQYPPQCPDPYYGADINAVSTEDFTEIPIKRKQKLNQLKKEKTRLIMKCACGGTHIHNKFEALKEEEDNEDEETVECHMLDCPQPTREVNHVNSKGRQIEIYVDSGAGVSHAGRNIRRLPAAKNRKDRGRVRCGKRRKNQEPRRKGIGVIPKKRRPVWVQIPGGRHSNESVGIDMQNSGPRKQGSTRP